MNLTAVCLDCGRPYYVDSGHICRSRRAAEAASLPESTPHPAPFLAERGWLVVGGIFQRPDGGGDGEEAAA